MRVVALDLGDRRVGVAVSDPGGVLATPHDTIQRTGDPAADLGRLVAVVRELGGERVVVGLPLSLSGDHGPAALKVEDEAEALAGALAAAGLDVPVELSDERLTTVTADRSMRTSKRKGRARRQVIDQVAATVILQHWLEGPAARRARAAASEAGPAPGAGPAGGAPA